jgi:surface polysaccharide O-acyltransferase-like enzyme
MKRNFTIDMVRLIAAFCIMTMHTDLPGFGLGISSIIRLSGRWAVPFFFIATGYFLGSKINNSNRLSINNIEKNVMNLISIFITSSIIYLIHTSIFSHPWFENNVSFLLNGTYWHLWFIGSMIFGYLFIWYIYNAGFERFLPLIAILLLFIAVISDSYDTIINKNFTYEELPRFLTSIPFMYIGIYLSKRNIKQKRLSIWIVIFLIGFILQFIEAFLLYKIYNYPLGEHQMLIGTIVCSVSVFIICLSFNTNENRVSIYGKKYSLFIYLYHIIGYWIIGQLFVAFGIVVSDYIRLLMPLIGFIFMLGITITLDKISPRLFCILNGNLTVGNTRS